MRSRYKRGREVNVEADERRDRRKRAHSLSALALAAVIQRRVQMFIPVCRTRADDSRYEVNDFSPKPGIGQLGKDQPERDARR